MCWHPALYAIMGAHDAREYVSAEEWAKPPYDNIVRLNIYKSLYIELVFVPDSMSGMI